MGLNTTIEYCDSTINPVVGCHGCELWSPYGQLKERCYAAALGKRWAGRAGWPMDFGQPEFFAGRLEKALAWPDLTGTDRPDKPWLNGLPRLVFVNDLSETWLEFPVPENPDPEEWLTPALPAMAESPHIWLFLTKQPHAMARYWTWRGAVPDNFWLGVTVTNRFKLWRLRRLHLCSYPVRWISFEPLVGPVIHPDDPEQLEWAGFQPDWIVAGAESGPNAFGPNPDWFRSLRDHCQDKLIPFFFKGWGGPNYQGWVINNRLYSGGQLDGELHRQMPRCVQKVQEN